MRVVSMVPSWTETLIEAGIEVVGRTRFCIHPAEKVKSIPVVGGTKDLDLEKLDKIEFDYLLLDKEENPKKAAAGNSKTIVTHVKSVTDVIGELNELATTLQSDALADFANRWQSVVHKLKLKRTNNLVHLHKLNVEELHKLGVIKWITLLGQPCGRLVYIIWKNPYMAVTKETFVGSMLDLVGLPTLLSEVDYGKKYPEIDLEKFDKTNTLFLFSSEPFPFHKKVAELEALGVSAAIVDGESYSWFGLRALKFLENQLK